MKDKGEAGHFPKQFIIVVKNQFGKGVKVVRTDNGAEFKYGPMLKFYSEQGITHQTSCANAPQQNGRVERKHHHILNVARALRFQANLLLRFWGECVLTGTPLTNRTPNRILDGKTPHELLFGQPSTYDHIKVFGSLCSAKIRPKDKFTSWSRRRVFVGYPFGQKGWKLYDAEIEEIFVSRDVIFFETIFPLRNSQSDLQLPSSTTWAILTGLMMLKTPQLPGPILEPASGIEGRGGHKPS